MSVRTLFLWLIVSGGIAACAGGGGSNGSALLPQRHHRGSPSTPISHVIIVIQENRSFDNLFATFPGANGATVGEAIPMPSPAAQWCADRGQQVVTKPTTVPLTAVSLVGKGFPTAPPTGQPYGWDQDPAYTYQPGYLVDCNSAAGQPNASNPCRMNGFDVTLFGPNGEGPGYTCTYLYQYVKPGDIAPYWDMAKQYVLADNIFQSQGSSSFTAHQDLIAAGTSINGTASDPSGTESAIDNPLYGFPWGCDSAPGNAEPYLTIYGQYHAKGPLPCYPVQSSYSYATMRDLLDGAGVSWKFYANAVHATGKKAGSSGIWSAFDAISAVRYGNEWGTNVVWPDTKIFTDIKNGALPAVSWVTPDGRDSDHPYIQPCLCDSGPSWVTSIVNAVGESSYWDSSAVVVLWDDYGGFYDHVPPPFYDSQGGLGFRIPMLIISPYVQPHVEHTQYETASILKFIEQNWNLPSLGKLDKRAKNSIAGAFDFSTSPRKFKKISSKYPLSFFLHRKPSGLPPDTE